MHDGLIPDTFHPLSVGGAVRAASWRGPSRIAIQCSHRSLTYGQLVSRMGRVGAVAQDGFGLGLGARAAIIAPNCLEYMEICLGLSEVGIAVATLNPRLSSQEIAEILSDCEPRVIFVDESAEDGAREALELLGEGAPELVVIGPRYERLLERASDSIGNPEFPEWTTFSIPYTSGTSGSPKGVLLPHRSRALTAFAMAVEFGCFGPDDDFLAIAPMAHGAGFAFGMAPLLFGGTCSILPIFDPEEALLAMVGGRHTGVFLVPTHFHRIFALPDSVLQRHRGSGRLRAIMSNAAPLPQSTKRQIVEYFGEGLLHELYGATETGVVTNLRPEFQLEKENCVGTPLPWTEVELRDEHGVRVQDGVPGELFSRSPYLFNGYHNRPEATRETFSGDGWASVGDIAVRDKDGFYYIVDRKKDMVISGGMNVYPKEVERFLDNLAGVVESAVVGAQDPEWGERVVAFVVPKISVPITPESVLAACKNALSGYKAPRAVYFIETLPRNANGKVLKRELRNRAAELQS